jgi:ribosomal protein RSM22 (predicted rRNA methylase)
MALTKRCFQLFLPAPDAKSRDPQALPPPKKSASTNLVPRDVAKQKATSKTGRVLDLTLQPLKLMPRQTTPELVLAHAAAELPSQYAVMRTIMRELQSRNGWDAPGAEGRIQIVDFAAGYGATAWAAAATLPSPREKRNALVLIEPSPLVSDLSRELLKVDTPGPLARWPTLHFRSLHKYQTATGAPRLRSEKSVGVLAFALSALARPQDRRRKLKELWYSGVESVVVVEMGHRDGWTAVEEAREFLLGIGREERAEAAKQAGEWVPPTPSPTEEQAPKPAAADEPAAAEPALVVPRTRGRRRPGERARPSTMAAAEKESASAAEPRLEGGLSVDHGQLDVAHKRKPEKFVFNGVEFEEVDEAIDGADANQSKEAVEWTADGKELVRDGRILGNWVVAPVCLALPDLRLRPRTSSDRVPLRAWQCPHDEKCPLASTPTPCAFSQLLETPVVTRLTKNVKQDQSRLNFSYFILRRGTRPEISEEDRGEGREGEVAREVRLAQAERDGAVAVLGEDGIFDVPDKPAGVGGDAAELPPVDYSKLRREISEWGRVLKAPIHRKGHSEVDLCTADGTYQTAKVGSGCCGLLTPSTLPPIRHDQADDVLQEARQAGLVRHRPDRGGRRLPAQVEDRGRPRARHQPPRACPQDQQDRRPGRRRLGHRQAVVRRVEGGERNARCHGCPSARLRQRQAAQEQALDRRVFGRD